MVLGIVTAFTILLAAPALVLCQRPFFAGIRPIGYPDTPNRTTTEGVVDRFGEDTTTQRLPIEANGDKDLVDRLSKLPIDKQPFWLINWQALEANRNKPQTFVERPNTFLSPMPNPANPNNNVSPNVNSGSSNVNSGSTNTNVGSPNVNPATASINTGLTNLNTGSPNVNLGSPNVNSTPANTNVQNTNLGNRFESDVTPVKVSNTIPETTSTTEKYGLIWLLNQYSTTETAKPKSV